MPLSFYNECVSDGSLSFESTLKCGIFIAEVKRFVTLKEGFLIVYNIIMNKLYSERINFVRHMWSGKYFLTVEGIVLIILVWLVGEFIAYVFW